MAKYLYGASVQGIQEFIFATNVLKEIVGASEIIKNIENIFIDSIKNMSVEVLMNAAGNIKAVFANKEECQKIVLEFEKKVMQSAYGITLSQGVIEIQGEKYTQEEMQKLMQNIKVQRSKPQIALDPHIGILKRNPKTSRPLINKDYDKATHQKIEMYNQWLEKNPRNKEFKEIGKFSNGKNKIAVIHIDGNNLGQIIPKLKISLSEFSRKLDSATKKAFHDARDESMSIREVVLGGDDVTVICNANDALAFTQKFLQNFETETKELDENGLTACAGIAYCNHKYPFHYAVNLAEALCSHAKKDAKKLNKQTTPSCLMFHNIQSSNFQSWDKFTKDELTIQNDKQTVYLDFGPYYLNHEEKPLIANFLNSVEAYRCQGSPISRLRNWMSELYKSSQYAEQLLERINDVTAQSGKWNCKAMQNNLARLYKRLSNDKLIIQKDGVAKTPIYDILQILSTTEMK